MENLRRQKLAEKLAKRLSNQDMENITESIDRACDFMRNFCGREDIPPAADFLIFDMAIELLKSGTSEERRVKEISRGDTKISYEESKTGLSSVFGNFSDRLIRFRKLGLIRRD
ncbi:MAG: hypothetical protein Q4A72_05470 [Bacillota bacterium]|nr:hypothetical protein [Bacillota bacterium]